MTLKGRFGTVTFERDGEPDIGSGDIEYIAVYEGAIDYKDDAILGPVAVGDTEAVEFREELENRVSDPEFKDFVKED